MYKIITKDFNIVINTEQNIVIFCQMQCKAISTNFNLYLKKCQAIYKDSPYDKPKTRIGESE